MSRPKKLIKEESYNLNQLSYRLIERNIIKCLQIFSLAFEAGGLKPLARQAKMSPAKISKYIKYLEEDMNIQLISKTKNQENGTFFTNEAEKVYILTADLLKNIEIMERNLRNFQKPTNYNDSNHRYLIKVETHSIGFREIFPEVLDNYFNISENICFEINIETRAKILENLKKDKIDMALIPLDQELLNTSDMSDFIFKEISPYNIFIHMGEDHKYKNVRTDYFNYKDAIDSNLIGIDKDSMFPGVFRSLNALSSYDIQRFETNEQDPYILEGFIRKNVCIFASEKTNSFGILFKNIESKLLTKTNWYLIYSKYTKFAKEMERIEKFIRNSKFAKESNLIK